MWMLKGYFDNISEDIDNAGKIDGCNIFQRLFYVIIPIAAPGIMVAAFYSFVVSWGDYLIVSIITQSQRTATLTLVLQRLSSSLIVRWGQVAAATTLTIIPTILLFAIVQKGLVEGLTSGAIISKHFLWRIRKHKTYATLTGIGTNLLYAALLCYPFLQCLDIIERFPNICTLISPIIQ